MIIMWTNLIKYEGGDEKTQRIAKRTGKNHFISGKSAVCWCNPNAAMCEVQDASGDGSNAWKTSNDTLCHGNDFPSASYSHSTRPATLSQRRPGASQAICNPRLIGTILEFLAGAKVQAIRYVDP